MMKILGPYLRPDGRKHIIWSDYQTGYRKTQSYPRFIMEMKLGRALEAWETVDHIDGDFTNDSFSNLQLLSLADNIRKSVPKVEEWICVCPTCGIKFSAKARRIRDNQIKQGKRGPYCSRTCGGRAGIRYTESA